MTFNIDILSELDDNKGSGYRLGFTKADHTTVNNTRSKAKRYFSVSVDNDYEKSIRQYIKSKGLRTNKWYPLFMSTVDVKTLRKDIKNLGRRDQSILSSIYKRISKYT